MTAGKQTFAMSARERARPFHHNSDAMVHFNTTTGPDDGIERGLLGFFINANIENQYEFVLKEWMNDAEFVGSVRLNPKSKDVLSGANDPKDSIFEIRQPGNAPTLKITGFSRFVTTRAVAYCFLPSVTALKVIAGLS